MIMGWGFFNGNTIPIQNGKVWAAEGQDGAKIFATNCGNCHPNGGNIINHDLPVIGSPHMKTLDAFTKFNRQPVKADGSKSIMPAFPQEKISDHDMKMIYEYLKKLLPPKK